MTNNPNLIVSKRKLDDGRKVCSYPDMGFNEAVFPFVEEFLAETFPDCGTLSAGTTSRESFSQATKSVACGLSSGDEQGFYERLTAQLEKDANEIRKTCAIVRDPNELRTVTYKSGDDMMAVTRRLCLGQ